MNYNISTKEMAKKQILNFDSSPENQEQIRILTKITNDEELTKEERESILNYSVRLTRESLEEIRQKIEKHINRVEFKTT